MRIMALDIGTVRSGVAVTDPTQTIARPLAVVDSQDLDALKEALQRLIQDYGVERVIVGIPLSLSGHRGPMARWVEGVRRDLAASLPVPVEPWDERFSSTSAARALLDARPSKTTRSRRQDADAAAAAIVLQSYLDHVRLRQAGHEAPSPARPPKRRRPQP